MVSNSSNDESSSVSYVQPLDEGDCVDESVRYFRNSLVLRMFI